MAFDKLIEAVLQQTGPGKRVSACAYDTGWLARLGAVHTGLSQGALNWLRAHQLPDGTWGASEPVYYHDRLICTLSAMAALAQYGEAEDIPRLQRAQANLPALVPALSQDLAGETVGFEMLVPRLFAEISASNFAVPVDTPWIQKLTRKRQAKLAMLPQGRINRHVSLSYSLEMLDERTLDLLDVQNLVERDGSVGCSPAATAFWAKISKELQPTALHYYQTYLVDGQAVPCVAPIDVFEVSWVFWNLALAGFDRKRFEPLIEPGLDFLEKTWTPGRGVASMSPWSCYDGDATSLVHATLATFGRYLDLDAIFLYEATDHFITYPLEANPAVSTNIHVLEALLNAGLPQEHPSVQKIVRFMERVRLDRTYWFDKWQASPYYTTAHAIVTLTPCAPQVASAAVEWLLESQRPDGSWGFFLAASAEETAYCMQALCTWRQRYQGEVPKDVLKRAADWLMANQHLPYAPLWIGKCLYCPEIVVQSAVVSALMLVSQIT